MQILVDIIMEALHYLRLSSIPITFILIFLVLGHFRRIDIVLEVPLSLSRDTVGTRL